MKTHLAKHGIYCPTSSTQPAKKGPDIRSFMGGKQSLIHQEVLERNAIRWIVTDIKAFTTVKSPEFQQMFRDILGIEPPFTSHRTLRDRIIQDGENLAIAVENMLIELSLEDKLISITGDNASNNEAMASELYFFLSDRPRVEDAMLAPLYRGLDSYIRCLAHVLNLIVKDILRNLGSGMVEGAQVACDCLQTGNSITDNSAIGRLRVLALWINRSPQRRQKWKEICRLNNRPDKFVAYDVTTRRNSTFRMVDDGLKSRQQVNKFLHLQDELPSFTLQDWSRLEQIHTVLHNFNELTLFISKRNPQISLAVPIYYELHELLDDVPEGNGDFAKLDRDIIAAVKEGMKKYKKYYSIMDDCDTYYTALVLDPRVKGEMVLRELQDGNAGTMIMETIRTNLHQVYAASNLEHDAAASKSSSLQHSDVESRMLKKLQARDPQLSDIDKYFDTPPISVANTTGQNWLCNWWKMHKGKHPRMAEAARDYLAIPASEVAVERVFSTARDVLGIRRYSLKGDTLRMLMLIRDGYKW
ncbi:hypothetical protein N7532_011352 [Penicillium argentinense]|uniref:HAT C-terminal dimerisation domain-containing protein n=1 Tax=Penicillium argentinense TaxID=1131581 RepID=A0A9W9EIA3_9EURO|nr:uncharacterized protein N7532_011352 [Penicillium argentinense]KAJ5082309.1 hypothetical protein N7532_011352 [Penicillium argentinense]